MDNFVPRVGDTFDLKTKGRVVKIASDYPDTIIVNIERNPVSGSDHAYSIYLKNNDPRISFHPRKINIELNEQDVEELSFYCEVAYELFRGGSRTNYHEPCRVCKIVAEFMANINK